MQEERAEIQRRIAQGLPPRPEGEAQPAGGALEPQAIMAPEGAIEHLEGDGNLALNFGNENIDLLTFIDYIGLVLGVNFVPDQSLAQQQILFRAPIEIPKERLLPLLSAILEDKGFVLIEDPELGYFIKPVANVGVNFDGELFASTRIIRTPMVKPSSLQQAITAQLPQGQTIRTTVFDELGILVITGSPRLVDSVEELVTRLLDEVARQFNHKFELTYVEAGFARSRILRLNGLFSGAAAAGPVGGGAPTGPGGALSNLESRLFTDSGNRLVFRGSEEEAEKVAELVEMVDSVNPLIPKRYSAGTVAMQIAEAGQREGLGPVIESQSGGTGGSSLFSGGRPGAGGTSESEPNTSGFSLDAENGTFVYHGTEAQHKRVAELVKTFTDQIMGSRIDIKMYKLNNAEAESVAELLNSLIQDNSQQSGTSPFLPGSRTQGLRQQRNTVAAPTLEPAATDTADGGTSGAPGEGTGNALAAPVEISIVADPDRNQIIVKAPARQQAQIEQIIQRLDQRQPQVYIEAQIVSISTGDDFNWTVETQINAGQFLLFTNFGLSTAGTATGGDQAAQAVRQVGTGNRGLTSAVIKSEFVPIILNTLQSETNARITSNPRILVNDNQTGTISSTREEPFATTTQGTATTTTGQGGVASAGTTLEVTPRISHGGYISLEYSVELSSFVGNPASGLQPPRQTENYDSQVTVPSDSTIVVGGFTLAQDSESDSGIPLLKDIPLIGNLFKAYGTSKRRTTIFVFITPTIMTDPNFIDLRLASEGPMRMMGVEGETPELLPAEIPISSGDMLKRRNLPTNQAPVGP